MSENVQSFRDLRIWTQGIAIVKETYGITGGFPRKETFGLASQMQRAAVSIPSNIAEGHIRATKKEFTQFLRIALGSCAELETQVIIAKELGYVQEVSADAFINFIASEARQIRQLILRLAESNPQPPIPNPPTSRR
jgi:four helix bundle protein